MRKQLRIFLLAGICMLLLSTVAGAKTYYVDVNSGSDNNLGTQDKPFSSIQKAADSVAAGDTVIVMPGVYYESVQITKTGTKEKPIVFRAYDNAKDKVIVTMADKDILEGKTKWTLEDAELGIWSVPFHNDCPRMLVNGADMHNYSSLEKLKTFSDLFTGDHYTQNTPHGYYFSEAEQKMYVRISEDSLYGSSNPNENKMWLPVGEKNIRGTTNKGSVVTTLNYSENVSTFAVVTEKPSYIVIYGFTFAAPFYNGVYIRANNVTVSNCWMYGCMTGVAGAARHFYDYEYLSDDIKVEYCNYSSWPTFEDAMNIMANRMKVQEAGGKYGYEYHFWQKKYMYNEHGVSAAFGGYENGGFLGHAGHNWVIGHNVITNQLDGNSFFAQSPYAYYIDGYGSSIGAPLDSHMTYYENRFEKCLDDCIEFDASGIKYTEMYRNEFVDSFQIFSWQPLNGTPFPTNIKLHHNLIYDTDDFSARWKYLTNNKYPTGVFKLGLTFRYWKQLPWLMQEPYDEPNNRMFFFPRAEEEGLQFYNNTIVRGETGSFLNEVGTTGTSVNKTNFLFKNNLIQTAVFTDTAEREENSVCREDRGYDFESNVFLNITDKEVVSNPVTGLLSKGGKSHKTDLTDVFVDAKNYDFRLKDGSVAIDAAHTIPEEELPTEDAGAIPYGENWDITYDPHPYGDIDCDGLVTLKDFVAQSSVFGKERSDERYTERADMNFDGTVNDADAVLLAEQYALFGQDGGVQ